MARAPQQGASQRSGQSKMSITGRIIFGLLLVVSGAVLTLANLGYLDQEQVIRFWPVILIVIGATHLARPAASRCLSTGLLWLVAGAGLLLQQLEIVQLDLWEMWPLGLVLLGVSMITRRAGHACRADRTRTPASSQVR